VLSVYKYSLLPVLLAQALRLRRTAIRLPEPPGPREGRAGDGSEAGVRVLFVGDSSAAGVGVTHQSNALALPTARLLASRLKATVHWELIARSGVNTAQALQMLKQSVVRRADLLVTALGTNDVTSQQSPRKFIAAYKALLDYAVTHLGVAGAVITGLPPLRILPAAPQPLRWYLGQYGQRLDLLLQRWCSASENLSYLSLDWAAVPHEMAADGYHPGDGQYGRWSGLVTDRLLELVNRMRAAPTCGS
jgi:lysophospholipase L1-like esterase